MDATIGGPEISSHFDVLLSTGHTMPQRAFGTGSESHDNHPDKQGKGGRELINAVKTALYAGFRHLDCAEHYGTESAVGEAIREYLTETGFKRELLFITSKVHDVEGDIAAAAERSIERLDVGYLDLYLLHSPFFKHSGKVSIPQAWSQMEKLQQHGRASAIGVANFRPEDLDELFESPQTQIPPAVNQIECNPCLQERDIVQYCKQHGVQIVCYNPFAPLTVRGPLDSVLEELSHTYGKTKEQVLLRWNLQHGRGVVATSWNERQINYYMDIMDFLLGEEDMNRIDVVGSKCHLRKFWINEFATHDASAHAQ